MVPFKNNLFYGFVFKLSFEQEQGLEWRETSGREGRLCSSLHQPLAAAAHGVSQARILEWVAISSSRGSFPPRDWTCVSGAATLRQRYTYQKRGTRISLKASKKKIDSPRAKFTLLNSPRLCYFYSSSVQVSWSDLSDTGNFLLCSMPSSLLIFHVKLSWLFDQQIPHFIQSIPAIPNDKRLLLLLFLAMNVL